MENYSVPKNYKVIESNGLKGLVRIAKDGSEKTVVECINKICLPAKSYGKIFIAYLPVGEEQSIRLCNYNGSVACKLPIYNIRFGASSLYIRTINPANNEVSWCLLNKNLIPVRYLGDFEITDRYCNDRYYIPVGHEFMEVTKADGKKYSVELTTGNVEEIKPIIRKRPEVVEVIPTKYDITFDIIKERISATPDVGTEFNVQRLSNLYEHMKLFTLLLGAPAEKLTEHEIKGSKEKRFDYKFSNIAKDKAELFFSVVRRFENMGDSESLPLICKHIQNKFKSLGVSFDMLTELYKELHTDFYVVKKEKDGNYEVKCYAVGGNIVVLVQNKNGRLVPVVHNIENSSAFDENDCLVLKSTYQIAGYNSLELKIDNLFVNSVQCTEDQTCKLPRPYSVLKRKELNNTIKSTYYEGLHQVEVDVKVPMLNNTFENISFSIGICDGFCYIPKSQRYAKTVVAKGKTNNILVMLG